MSYFVLIDSEKSSFPYNLYSPLLKRVICTFYKIYKCYTLCFYLNLWLKYVVKY